MRTPPPAPPILAIVGPTAVGKTDLALAVARELPVEILVADSRQVYRGLDIGTAKPDAAARAAVPHHLLDLVAPDARFTVADWLAAARPVVTAVGERGRLPLLVGGTGLYVTALLDGYQLAPGGHDPALRAQLDARLAREGLPALAADLAHGDPQHAAAIDLRNPRRVVPALERVLLGTSRGAARPYPGRVTIIGLRRQPAVLAARIAARATAMFDDGLLREVAALREGGYGAGMRSLDSHGYREAVRLLAGEWGPEEALASTILRTRRYARRQVAWWRRDPRVRWLDAGDGAADDPALVAAALAIAAGE